MQLFYQEGLQENIQDFIFDKIESRHIVRVLRKKEGDILYITNGKNQLFKVEISLANEKKCHVKILDIETKLPVRKYAISIAIAPTKNNDRFEWFLEKATEIGIDEIFPIICDHSERKVIKHERLQKVLISAMKQSLQYKLPILHHAMSYNKFIALNKESDQYIAYCENTEKATGRSLFANIIKPRKNNCILIGPEGDFSSKEIKLAFKNKYIPVSLGATRLRTETAGIVAVHTVNLINSIYEK